MANVLDIQITEEGPRNGVVKLTGILDTSDVSEVPAIALQDFINNDASSGPLIGLRVDLIEWSISQGTEVQLSWDGLNPQQIFPLAGRGRISSTNYGGFLPDMTRTGYTGNINLNTTGWANSLSPGAVQNFTIILELVKLYGR